MKKNNFDFKDADDLTKKLGLLLLQGWSSQSEERKLIFINGFLKILG